MDIRQLTLPERVARLETQNEHILEQQAMIITKLDTLLAFKHKGLGALGLVTAILGSSIIGGVSILFEWLRNTHG